MATVTLYDICKMELSTITRRNIDPPHGRYYTCIRAIGEKHEMVLCPWCEHVLFEVMAGEQRKEIANRSRAYQLPSAIRTLVRSIAKSFADKEK